MAGGQIYPEGAESLNLKTFERLRVGEERDTEWVELPQLKVARRQLGCAVVRSKSGQMGVVVVGGTGDDKEAETAVEFFSLEAGQEADWERWPDLTTPRCCWPQVGMLENNIVAIGGEKRPSNTFEKFDPEVRLVVR